MRSFQKTIENRVNSHPKSDASSSSASKLVAALSLERKLKGLYAWT